MLFRSERVPATWDTWMYYHEGTYYLYYLITGASPGEGLKGRRPLDGSRLGDPRFGQDGALPGHGICVGRSLL
jgi:hypothetical protein